LLQSPTINSDLHSFPTRRSSDLEQKLTVPEAVEAYTMGSAYAEFQDKEKGSITPGKLADMVLVSDDLFTIAPAKIREVKVLKTIDRKSTRLNSSHGSISYAVFCL